MDAVKFLEEDSRMCNTYNDCIGCPIHDKPFCHPHDMTTNDERKGLVNAVEKWSEEHPIMTSEMSDNISRAMAIDALFELYEYQRDIDPTEAADLVRQGIYLAEKKIEQLPSAQPERLTDDDFETIRIHLDAYKEKLCNQERWKEAKEYQRIYDRFMAFASAQVDRPQGEWIGEADGYADGELVYDTWYCSNCGYVVDDDEPPTWNYCPNCGSYNGGGQSD